MRQDADSTYKANVSAVIERITGHHAAVSSGSLLLDQLMAINDMDPVIGAAFANGLSAGRGEALKQELTLEQQIMLEEYLSVLSR